MVKRFNAIPVGRLAHDMRECVPASDYDALQARCERLEAAKIAELKKAIWELIDECDLTCLRANEEISESEGCPCVVCLARVAALREPGSAVDRRGEPT
jgi:hypothetical protein